MLEGDGRTFAEVRADRLKSALQEPAAMNAVGMSAIRAMVLTSNHHGATQ